MSLLYIILIVLAVVLVVLGLGVCIVKKIYSHSVIDKSLLLTRTLFFGNKVNNDVECLDNDKPEIIKSVDASVVMDDEIL